MGTVALADRIGEMLYERGAVVVLGEGLFEVCEVSHYVI